MLNIIPARSDLTVLPKSMEIDEIRNYFVNEVDSVELLSIDNDDIWIFRFIGENICFKIDNDIREFIFYNAHSQNTWTTEEILMDPNIVFKVKNIIAHNLDIFSKKFHRKITWTIKESIGVGIVNSRGLSKLNVGKN